jgi:hypothetical protein
MTTTTTTTTQPVNYIFIVFYCIILAVLTGLFVQRSYISTFLLQSGITTIILYVICIAFLFNTIPDTWISKYPYFFVLMFILSFGAVFLRKASVLPVSSYFEMPYKILIATSAIALFILFWINNPADLFNATYYSKTTSALILTSALLALIGLLTYLTVPRESAQIFQRSMGILLGVIASVIFISWLIWTIVAHTGKTSPLSITLLVLFIIVIYILLNAILKLPILSSQRGNAAYELLNNTILYLPCLANIAYNRAMGRSSGMGFGTKSWGLGTGMKNAGNTASQYASRAAENVSATTPEIWGLLAISVGLLVAYYYIPGINQKLYLGHCRQLLTTPTTLHEPTTIATYDSLNETDTPTAYNYKYGISLWVYLDAHGANMNQSYNKYTAIFSYGNKPLIEYNGATNSLRITISSATGATNMKQHPTIVYDERGAMPLQKWVNIGVNYVGGTVDVFIDGKLLKSVGGVVPFMSLDNMIVGSPDGLYGKVCNVIYAPRPFTMSELYYLRYLVKDSNPPVFTGKFI